MVQHTPKPPHWFRRPLVMTPNHPLYALRLGQALYRGSERNEGRRLHDGAFLTPYTRIARQFTAHDPAKPFRQGYLTKYRTNALPRLVWLAKMRHLHSFSWLLYTMGAEIFPGSSNRERAREAARVRPPWADGWYIYNFEYVFWQPMKWLTYVGAKRASFDLKTELFYHHSGMVTYPKTDRDKFVRGPKRRGLEGLEDLDFTQQTYENFDMTEEEAERPYEPYGPIHPSLLVTDPEDA